MKLKSPIKKFDNEPITLTLPYGDKTYVPQYRLLGWNLAFHNGEDYICSSNPLRTYGIPILASHDGVVDKVVWDGIMSVKGNGITISGLPFQDDYGKQRIISTVYWHLSQISVKAGDKVKAGDIIGRMGNSGFVIGSSTLPQKGTHLHFGVYSYIFQDGKWQLEFPANGVNGAVKPSDYLENLWQNNAPVMGFSDYFAYIMDVQKLFNLIFRK